MLIVKSRLFGGAGGAAFDEVAQHITSIQRIVIHYSQFVHQLEVTYALEHGEPLVRTYGKPGGSDVAEIDLADDEKIFAAVVHSGEYVDSLTFVTYHLFNLVGMKKYGPFGGAGGQPATVLSPNIREFFGRAGNLLDAIGFRGEEPLLIC